MRPSWPAPMTPIFMSDDGGTARVGLCEHLVGLRGAELHRARRGSSACVLARIDAASNAALVAPADADGERADRDAGRHLHDRQQRIESVERLRLHRHAEHRQRRLRRRHARQVRRAAGARDDDLQAASRAVAAYSNSRSGVRCAETTRTSCGDAEPLEHFGGGLEGLPVGRRPHDDANERFHRGIVHSALEKPTFRRRQGPRAACRNSCRAAAGGLAAACSARACLRQRTHLLQ